MPHRLRNKRLLVAEPASTMAELLVSLLRGIGIREIAKTLDSQSAELALATRSFDAAVISFDLRPKNIAELVVGLRRVRGRNAHIPILGIAGSINERDLADAMRAGVSKVVRKPVSGQMLRARLLPLLFADEAPADDTAFQEI